jgi:hypothetical protein
MPKRYTAKSGKVIVFPDDATPEEIQAIADEADGVSAPKPAPSAPSFRQSLANVVRAMPIGGLPGAMGDVGRVTVGKTAADAIQDPASFIPTAGAQAGAMGGAALGTSVAPGVGTVIGGIIGAGLGGGGGKAAENKIKARPVGEGVMGEAGMQAFTQAVPTVIGSPLKAMGRTLYTKALKPAAADLAKMTENSRMMPDQMRTYLADIGLKNNVSVSNRGLHQVEGLKDTIEQRIKDKIAEADAQGVQIDMRKVLSDARSSLNNSFGTQSIPQDDMGVINEGLSKFAENPMLRKPTMQATMPGERMMADVRGEAAPMFTQTGDAFGARQPVGKINAIRVGTNKATKDKFGELKRAGVEVNKALSRAESNAVKEAVPSTKSDFKDWHDLINLQKVLTRTTTNSANAQPVRLYELLGVLSGNPAAMGLGALSRSAVQGSAGRGMFKTGYGVESLSPDLLRALLLARMDQSNQEPR